MDIEKLKELSIKVIDLNEKLTITFGGTKEDHLHIAIMAGLKSAYNEGLVERINKKIKK